MALFVGGEEQGPLGSGYYAAHPTIPVGKIAANLNIDGGNIFGRTKDVAIIGKGKSDLEDRLPKAAKLQARTVVRPEPEPDKGYYYRSDQLNFARSRRSRALLQVRADLHRTPRRMGQGEGSRVSQDPLPPAERRDHARMEARRNG